MLVVKFDVRRWNFLSIGDTTYFLLGRGSQRHILVKDRCPHRNGPLHLACYDETGLKVICPWHESQISLAWMLATAVPMVCIDYQAVAFFPLPVETEVHLIHRQIKLESVPTQVADALCRKRKMASAPGAMRKRCESKKD